MKNAGRESSVIDEAAEWLATLSDPECTAEERRGFASWLKRSNLHVEEFLRVSTLTRRLETSFVWPDIDVDTPSSSIHPLPSVRKSERQSAGKPIRWTFAAAAVVALAFLIPAQLPRFLPSHSYSTAIGELRSITLEDGSIVQLNSQSRIREKFTARERRIELEQGEAIFKVTGNPARPFTVSTATANIIAIGTQFNVDSRPGSTIVTVIEGRVAVSSPSHPSVFLDTGEQATVKPSTPIQRIARVNTEKIVGWTARRLYFEDTPLAEAVGQFARYSSQIIRIEDPSLSQRRISGTFDSSDPAALVQFLERYSDTTITRSAGGWTVGRAPDK